MIVPCRVGLDVFLREGFGLRVWDLFAHQKLPELEVEKMLGLEEKSFPSFKLHNPKTVKAYVCISDFFEAVSIFRISTHQNCLNISEVVLFSV